MRSVISRLAKMMNDEVEVIKDISWSIIHVLVFSALYSHQCMVHNVPLLLNIKGTLYSGMDYGWATLIYQDYYVDVYRQLTGRRLRPGLGGGGGTPSGKGYQLRSDRGAVRVSSTTISYQITIVCMKMCS